MPLCTNTCRDGSLRYNNCYRAIFENCHHSEIYDVTIIPNITNSSGYKMLTFCSLDKKRGMDHCECYLMTPNGTFENGEIYYVYFIDLKMLLIMKGFWFCSF